MLAYSNLMNQITDPNIQILNVEYSVGITMEKDMTIRLFNPFRVLPQRRILMLFIPRLEFAEDVIKVDIGAVGTSQWDYWYSNIEMETYVTIGCGLKRVRADKWENSEDIDVNGKLSDEECISELRKLFERNTDNPILKHVEVRQLENHLYHLQMGKVHLFAEWQNDHADLLAGIGPSNKEVILTTNKCIVDEVKRTVLFQELAM